MKYINGIQISELRLIVHSTIFTILLLGLVVVIGFWVYTSLTMKKPKEKEHLRKLKEKAQSDELAKNSLKSLNVETSAEISERKKTSLQTFLFGAYLFVWVSLSWLGVSFQGGQIIFGKIMLFTKGKLPFISK